jgi:purine-nucleoside phosphorylase
MSNFDQVAEAAAFVQKELGSFAPRVGIVLGSGLGAVANDLTGPIAIPYADIPHFPPTTVAGHAGRLVAGRLAGVPVAVLKGRVHLYEGCTPQQIVFPVRLLGALGVRALILTNAAGAIHPDYRVGQLVALADHINFMGSNPLTGPNEPRFGFQPASGLRFFDMTEAYSRRLRALAIQSAAEEGFPLEEGVYIAVPGPSFETPAEIRAFRALGATLVGMSTVPETIAARHVGLEVFGLSCVTNSAAGLGFAPLSHEDVDAAGRQVEQRLTALLRRLVPRIAALYSTE